MLPVVMIIALEGNNSSYQQQALCDTHKDVIRQLALNSPFIKTCKLRVGIYTIRFNMASFK